MKKDDREVKRKMDQNRLKSPVVWGAVIAQVVTILVTLGVLDVGQSEAVNAVVAAVLQMLVLFGVFNNPTNKSGF